MEVPGYELGAELRRYSNHVVYDATRLETRERVALRIAECDESDEGEQERLLARAREFSNIRHPNLAEIVEVGSFGSCVFSATKWYDGGNLLAKLEKGITVDDLVDTFLKILDGLGAIHREQFIHGDLQPTNILFSKSGELVLNDALVVSLQISRSNEPLAGTDGYWSPEQQSGDVLEARSDFYSLGRLLFRCVLGYLPSSESDDNLGEWPVFNVLRGEDPEAARAIESVIVGLTAYEKDSRFETLEDIRHALLGIHGTLQLPLTSSRRDLIRTSEIVKVAGNLLSRSHSGMESPISMPRGTRRKVVTLGALLVAIVMLGSALLLNPNFLQLTQEIASDIGIGQHPELENAWLAAEAMRADPNQSLQSIIAAYNLVLDFEPNHPLAIETIDLLKEEWQTAFLSAMKENEIDVAENRLNELLQLYPRDPTVVSLFDQYQARRLATQLLDDTRAFIDQSGFDDDDSADFAIQSYREVSRLYPESEEAGEQLARFADFYANKAVYAANDGEVTQAMDYLGRAVGAHPVFDRLEEVREIITRAESLQAEINALLQEAGTLRLAGNLVSPAGSNAAVLYQRVLATDPENTIAAQGLGEIVASVRTTFNELLAIRSFGEIKRLVENAISVGLDLSFTSELQSTADQELQKIADAVDLVNQARNQVALGYITFPVDTNAVSLLREALRLDPKNNSAEELLQQCADRLLQVARDAKQSNMEDEASLYIELALTVLPDSVELRTLRDSWVEVEVSE